MPRGMPAKIGDETIAQNGYTWVRTENGMRYKHHLIAEEKLGRPLDLEREQVCFIDRDRHNFDPSNIEVRPKTPTSKAAKLARLYARRDEAQAQIDELEAS